MLFTSLKNYSPSQLVKDIVSGIIVAVIALPLSIALALASGVGPEEGLYTAIIAGFVISFLGGSTVQIAGPTAAFATIVAGIVARSGMTGLATATVMAGILLILMGIFRFGSLIKFIPYTITTGFTAGIAVTILVGQLKDFFGLSYPAGTAPVETMEKLEAFIANISTVNLHAVIVGAVCLAILIIWPYITKIIPGSLVAVAAGIVMVKVLGMEVLTIGDLYTVSGALPRFTAPDFSFATVRAMFGDAFTIAILAGIESLLSCVVADGMTGTKHRSNMELVAPGAGHIASALFGGIPATGAIARTAANVKNGGRSPISGITHAIVLLLFLLVLMPLAKMIPMPIIAAILFMVAYNMSEWRHFVHICRFSEASEVLVLIVTFVLTVVFDLVVAIAVGLVLAAILFMKRMSDVTHVRRWDGHEELDDVRAKPIPKGTIVYEINGPMFFADADKFLDFSMEEGTNTVILRMNAVPSIDATAMKNLEMLLHVCKQRNVLLLLSHVQEAPLSVMHKARFIQHLGGEHIVDSIDAAFAYAEQKHSICH